jgi:hypothetical protein
MQVVSCEQRNAETMSRNGFVGPGTIRLNVTPKSRTEPKRPTTVWLFVHHHTPHWCIIPLDQQHGETCARLRGPLCE